MMYKALCEYKCEEEIPTYNCRFVCIMLPRSRVRVPRLPRPAVRARDREFRLAAVLRRHSLGRT